MTRLRFATLWLAGCSGCHMSFLDLDEWLLDLASQIELVYSPLVDIKHYPDHVDVAVVEGAVANLEHLHLIREVRAHTRTLIALGDCAITGNVTALRNPLGHASVVLQTAYGSTTMASDGVLPRLLDRVLPVHAVVPVQLYLPGCPPPAPRIRTALTQLLAGEELHLAPSDLRFG